MDEDLKYLARINYLLMRVYSQNNYLKLLINRRDKRLNMSFKCKPPPLIRQCMRLNNFSWSRKHRYWKSYLNNTQVRRVRKIYMDLNKNR